MYFFAYQFTNGFRNYEKYCMSLIPKIEAYKAQKDIYPKHLSNINVNASFRYNPNKCGYIGQSNSFSFMVSDGFVGVAIYSSEKKPWVYD